MDPKDSFLSRISEKKDGLQNDIWESDDEALGAERLKDADG
jgi:hypothetical protein